MERFKVKGIKITFLDGKEDYYDPCEFITIDNGIHTFNIEAKDIKSISTYDVEETFPDDVNDDENGQFGVGA